MDTRDTGEIKDKHDEATAGKLAAEGVGGAAAGAAGAAIGAMAGPVGMIVGGLAGIVGGWWAGKAATESAKHYTTEDDRHYRDTYESSPSRLGDRSFDDVRPAYQVGHLAGKNPDYKGREWDAVEPDLQQGWTDEVRERHGEWDAARPFARDAFTRSRGTVSSPADVARDQDRQITNADDDSDLRPDT